MKEADAISRVMKVIWKIVRIYGRKLREFTGKAMRQLKDTGCGAMGAAFAGRMGILCLAAGIVLGAGVMFLASHHIVSEYEAELEKQTEKLEEETQVLKAERDELTEENAQLMLQADQEESAKASAEKLAGDTEDWALVLINEEHPLDRSYVPELAAIDAERSVDVRILDSLQQMMADGAAQGLSMYVTSAYRSYERQREVFNAGMQTRINSGMTPLDAYEDTKTAIAVPGSSEHASGLAVDIIASGYSELDERQADTAEQQWLMEHCWEYGFILRYPKDRSDVTGIIYEPWHYRYVGVEAAKEMTEQGLTLEEYMGVE